MSLRGVLLYENGGKDSFGTEVQEITKSGAGLSTVELLVALGVELCVALSQAGNSSKEPSTSSASSSVSIESPEQTTNTRIRQPRFRERLRAVHGCVDQISRSVDVALENDPKTSQPFRPFRGHIHRLKLREDTKGYASAPLDACHVFKHGMNPQHHSLWDVLRRFSGVNVLDSLHPQEGFNSCANGLLGKSAVNKGLDAMKLSLEPIDPVQEDGYSFRIHCHDPTLKELYLHSTGTFKQYADAEVGYAMGEDYALPDPGLLSLHHLICRVVNSRGNAERWDAKIARRDEEREMQEEEMQEFERRLEGGRFAVPLSCGSISSWRAGVVPGCAFGCE